MKYITTVEDKEFLVEIIDDKHISVNGKLYGVDFESVSGQPVYSLIVDGKSHESYVQRGDDNWQVLLRGRLYPVTVEDEREKRLRAASSGGVEESGEYHRCDPCYGRTGSEKGTGSVDSRIDENAERAQIAARWNRQPYQDQSW
jgi:hypothetical protein